MADHQLSTRDLAARSDRDGTDDSLETADRSDRASDRNPTDDRAAGYESAPSDEPLTRERAAAGAARTDAAVAEREPLLPPDQGERFDGRWQEIQTSFVDQPREAVAAADALVADLMQRLAATFAKEREQLEAQWDRGDDVDTEDLRIALTRYRSFFDRLLSA